MNDGSNFKASDWEKNYICISNTNTEEEDMKLPSENYQQNKGIPSEKIFESSDEVNSNISNVVVPNKVQKKNPHLIYSKYDKILPKKQITKENPNTNSLWNKYNLQIQKWNLELADHKKQIFQLRQENLSIQEENSYIKLEKEKRLKIKENEIELLNEKWVSAEQQNKKLTMTNESNMKKLEEYTPKVWKFDELTEKYEKLSRENDQLFDANNNWNTLLTNLKKDTAEKNSKYETLRLENDSLKQDKMYLSKSNLVNEDKIKSQEEKIRQLDEDMRETRRINQNYLDKLTDKHLNLDSTYKDKVNSELGEMKAKYENDIAKLKEQYDDLTEKKTSYLKEERDEYKGRCSVYEKTIKDKEETINLISSELRDLQSQSNEQLSYLKLQLNIKTEELNSRISIYDEQIATLSLFKNENESFKEKNDWLRSEWIKKESEFRAEISEYKAQIAVWKEKLSSYDNIENELDKVICESAVTDENADNNTNEIISIIKDIPTASKRRINQCLALANKVKWMQVENDKLKNMNTQLTGQWNALRDETEIYKKVSEQVKQPYAYWIKNIQDYELEIHKLKTENEKKEMTILRISKENALNEEKLESLGRDLKTIVANRQKMEDLENVITSFIQKEEQTNHSSTSMMNNPGSTYNPYNSQMNTSYVNNSMYMGNTNKCLVPEKDNNNTNFSYNQSNNMNVQPYGNNYSTYANNVSTTSSTVWPNWYIKLNEKKKNKNN